MALTKTPCRGKELPVFCDRISFVVLSESPVFIVVLSNSRLCATPFETKHTGFPLDFFRRLRVWRFWLVESVESFDQTVGIVGNDLWADFWIVGFLHGVWIKAL